MNPVGNTTLYCRYYTIVDEPCEEDTEDGEYLEKPEGNYLVLYYKGAYDTTYKAYSQILEYGRKHHFRLGEFSYEESFIDEVSENNPDNYVTQITVPFQFE
nr:GyrI-like domain-containing protein [Blautia glucerasea]